MKESKIFIVKPYKFPSTPTKSDSHSSKLNTSKEMKMNTVQLNLPFDCKYMSKRGEAIKNSVKKIKREPIVKKELRPAESQNKISQPRFSNQNLAKVQMMNDEK